MYLELLNDKWEEKLFKFELENKEFFETMVPGRSKEYFQRNSFKKVFQDLVHEQEKELSYFYLLIKNNEIVGRINIVNIDKEDLSASLGYRISQLYIRKGFASKAVRLIQDEVRTNLNLKTLKAKTTSTNKASQKVLTNNNFIKVLEDNESFEWKGLKTHFIHYSWTVNN